MARVSVRRGSEGPAHDPYSYTEVTFTTTAGDVVECHVGLGDWLEFRPPGQSRRVRVHDGVEPVFRALTGMSLRDAEAVPDLLLDRYLRRLPRAEAASVLQCMEIDAQMLRNCY